jgi:glutaminase
MCTESGRTGTGASPIDRFLQELLRKHRPDESGAVADYIPELAGADPGQFGICIATRDGKVYEVGDSRHEFTIQSISKALVFGLALEDRGENHMLARVGVEPSGEAFNAISLRPVSGTPRNPMINAGAIAVSGQVRPDSERGRIGRILDYLSACAGRPLGIDEAVYQSESRTGHRNRAIGWMLRNFNVIEDDPMEVLETYFRQCSVRVACRDLALMAATLANGGRNPVTGLQAVDRLAVGKILSVMSSCGMYDASGEWMYRVGLPAKSGVGGGILAVLPGQLGIGVFSPRLDRQGNSVRGVAVCEELSRRFGLHLFHEGAHPSPALRLAYDVSRVHSRRRRPAVQREGLARDGHRGRVLELQGELVFATIEPVVRRVHDEADGCLAFAFDLRNVVMADFASLGLLAQLQRALHNRGVRMLVCHAGRLMAPLLDHGIDPASLRPTADMALETLEDWVLAATERAEAAAPGGLVGCELLARLDAGELSVLQDCTVARTFAAGEALVHAGEAGDALYFLLSGSVEVQLPGPGGTAPVRVDVFGAGMSFGEMAFVDGAARSADIVAAVPVACRVLDRAAFDQLEQHHPKLKIRLLEAIARQMSGNVRRINSEVLAYKG